jgi:threonine dehydrogenase-like Zn-dependent dehydrogenase
MRAVRFHGQKDIRVEEIEEPVIEKGKVKVRCLRMPGSFNTVLPSFLPSFLTDFQIKPAFVGICGSGQPPP